jgi:hypothetical protein
MIIRLGTNDALIVQMALNFLRTDYPGLESMEGKERVDYLIDLFEPLPTRADGIEEERIAD